jgi:hypothetical protein
MGFKNKNINTATDVALLSDGLEKGFNLYFCHIYVE